MINLKQFWVAFKIWVIALAANTLLGSLYLAGSLEWDFMFPGLVFGSIFSFPIFCVILIVINHCVARKKDGLQLFRFVFIASIALTLFTSVLFFWLVSLAISSGLVVVALLACIIGVTTQYSSLFRLTDYDKKLEKFLL